MKIESIETEKINIDGSEKVSNYLLKSTKNFGILQPVIIVENGDGYRIIAGDRRVKAARRLGIKELPAVILEDTESRDNEIFLLIENLVRKRNIAKESETIRKLVEKGYDIQTISKITGISLTEIRKLYNLSIKLIPEIFEKLKTGEISSTTAFRTMQLTEKEQKSLLGEKITLKKVEKKIRAKKISQTCQTLRNISIIFRDIDREIELERIKAAIQKYSISKEELFGREE